MILADVCVRRPVFATMLVGSLVVAGWFSYKSLGLDLMPKAEMPVVTVTTTLPGAGPEEVEAQVTKPIEEAINTVSGIDELRSVTREGLSQVIVMFVLEKDLGVARMPDALRRLAVRLRLRRPAVVPATPQREGTF